MKLSRKNFVIAAAVVVLVALLNPRYSYVSVEGPNGPVKAEKFAFGPGGYVNYTRVLADQHSVSIDIRQE